jgi:hypothetical protein
MIYLKPDITDSFESWVDIMDAVKSKNTIDVDVKKWEQLTHCPSDEILDDIICQLYNRSKTKHILTLIRWVQQNHIQISVNVDRSIIDAMIKNDIRKRKLFEL